MIDEFGTSFVVNLAPCIRCGKSKTGECRAEAKSACKAYMEYYARQREEGRKRTVANDICAYTGKAIERMKRQSYSRERK